MSVAILKSKIFKVIKVEDALHPTTKKTLDLNSLRITEGLNYPSGYYNRGLITSNIAG